MVPAKVLCIYIHLHFRQALQHSVSGIELPSWFLGTSTVQKNSIGRSHLLWWLRGSWCICAWSKDLLLLER